MSLFETFSLALKNIWSNKLRTFLTMLGIIIGVTAVIVIVGLGNGMARYMEDSFASLGTNTLTVYLWGRNSSRSVSEEDMYQIVRDNPDYLEAISPIAYTQGVVRVGSQNRYSTSSTGVSEEYFTMKGYKIAQGRGLQYVDILDRKPVCVIGSYLAEAAYGGDAVGKSIKIGLNRLVIVGVLEQNVEEPMEGGVDDCLFLPYSTAARLFSDGRIDNYLLTVTDENKNAEAKQVVEDALNEIYGDSNAYWVQSMTEMLETMNSMLGIVITVLAVIAGISLVVGGIGIMNIMLVSVTERTREIGIRKALGAKEGAILRQFVMEAATTSALGGVVGILLGYLLSLAATQASALVMGTALTVTPATNSVLIAFGISAGIGILFGYLPARKAARLNPIEALRYD